MSKEGAETNGLFSCLLDLICAVLLNFWIKCSWSLQAKKM